MRTVLIHKEVMLGLEKYIIERVETKHTEDFSTKFWIMWVENKNGEMIKETLTVRQRITGDTKKFFSL